MLCSQPCRCCAAVPLQRGAALACPVQGRGPRPCSLGEGDRVPCGEQAGFPSSHGGRAGALCWGGSVHAAWCFCPLQSRPLGRGSAASSLPHCGWKLPSPQLLRKLLSHSLSPRDFPSRGFPKLGEEGGQKGVVNSLAARIPALP